MRQKRGPLSAWSSGEGGSNNFLLGAECTLRVFLVAKYISAASATLFRSEEALK